MSARQLVSFIEEHLDLGVTTVDHAGIHGRYQYGATFGRTVRLTPHLCEKMQIVTKCGIATTACVENTLGHCITDSTHITTSAEEPLELPATDRAGLLLIRRPDPFMDANDVTDAFKKLYHNGKVRHSGVSNFTPSQFSLLQSCLPSTLAINQVEISPVYQLLLLDGTLDQLQRSRIRPMTWSCLDDGRLLNDDAFQPLRDELTMVAEGLDTQSIEQVVYVRISRLPSQPLPVIGSGKIERVCATTESKSLNMSRRQWSDIRKTVLGYGVS